MRLSIVQWQVLHCRSEIFLSLPHNGENIKQTSRYEIALPCITKGQKLTTQKCDMKLFTDKNFLTCSSLNCCVNCTKRFLLQNTELIHSRSQHNNLVRACQGQPAHTDACHYQQLLGNYVLRNTFYTTLSTIPTSNRNSCCISINLTTLLLRTSSFN